MSVFAALLVLLSAAAAQTGHPLDGRIWDTRTRSFVDVEAALDRAAAARYVLLGEKHDNDLHHRLQLQVLEALDRRGRRPTLAMEQFDRERQPALAAAQAAGARDAEALADAGALDRKNWRWPMYKDLIAYAGTHGLPLIAANLSRADARAIALGRAEPALPPPGAGQLAAMEADIVRGHCGQKPPPERLTRLVAAQRARDARMAEALASAAGPAVLVAGAGHVRRDRGVPRYLAQGDDALAVAYVETEADKAAPDAYDGAGYDLLWFTPAADRPDPCAVPPAGLVAPAVSDRNKDSP